MTSKRQLRCAIYTRKSSEEGLDQEFNSLQAQREACEAFVTSQASLGWKLVKTAYDDGGISGGTMDRPALQALLAEIKAGRVDVVLVYKIDRLTRSLMDFARMVDVFDTHKVSFVSVTQQFNTTTSMGRLTLNVLLSFAQFEREVTAERIRDKIAASKEKGMWMGGRVPYGYAVQDRKLEVAANEAELVRIIYTLYLRLRSVRVLVERLMEQGIVARSGKPFSRGHLYRLLANPVYVGRITHRGKSFPGQHLGIVDVDLWQSCQDLLATNAGERVSRSNEVSRHLLVGRIFDETGDRLSPSHVKTRSRRYPYYVSNRLMTGKAGGSTGWRLPARQLDQALIAIVCNRLMHPQTMLHMVGYASADAASQNVLVTAAIECAERLKVGTAPDQKRLLQGILRRAVLTTDKIEIEIDGQKLLGEIAPALSPKIIEPPGHFTFSVPHSLRRRGVETKLVLPSELDHQKRRDSHLIMLIARAAQWHAMLTSGQYSSISEIANHTGADRNEISRVLPVAFLSPKLIQAILDGVQPADLTAETLRRLRVLPYDWEQQSRILGF